MCENSGEIVENNLIEELTKENKKLFNELFFANKCVNKLIEFKTIFDSNSIKIKEFLELNEWKKFEKVLKEFNEILFSRNELNYNERDDNIGEEVEVIVEDIVKDERMSSDEEYNDNTMQYEDSEVLDEISKDVNTGNMCLEESSCTNMETITLEDNTSEEHLKSPSDNIENGKDIVTSKNTIYRVLQNKYICSIDGCNKQFNILTQLKYHIENDHLGERQLRQALTCPANDCSFTTRSPIAMESHRTCHTVSQLINTEVPIVANKNNIFFCPHNRCQKYFSNKKVLKTHYKNVHLIDNSKELLRCPHRDCEFETRLPENMKTHKRIHRERSFVCPQFGCDYSTYMISNLRRHEKKTHKRVLTPLKPKQSKLQQIINPKSTTDNQEKDDNDTDNDNGNDNDKLMKNLLMILKCQYEGCEREFATMRDLKYHMTIVHLSDDSKPLLQCPVSGCLFETRNEKTLSQHSNVHSEKRFKCPHCESKFRWKWDINKHIRRLHSKTDKEKVEPKMTAKNAKTIASSLTSQTNNICNKISKESLEKEIKATLNISFKCSYVGCGKEFTTSFNLKQHIQYIHLKDNNEIVKCQYDNCSYETHNPDNMRKHVYNLHKEKKFVCDYPGCSFGSYLAHKLKRHKITHSDDKPIQCEWPGCEYRAKHKEILSSHMITHKTTFEFKCPQEGCEQMFKTQRAAKNHEKAMHTNRHIEYHCEWPGCDFKTHYRNSLDSHVKIVHGNPMRSFLCDRDECQAKFKTKRCLDNHISIVHDKIKNYSCSWPGCTFESYDRTGLKKHEIIHTGEKPFACDWPGCQYRTNSKSTLKYQHMKKHIKN